MDNQTKKLINKEEIEDEMKSLSRKRDKLILEVNTIQKQLTDLEEKYLLLDKSYIRVECFNPGCNGTGYLRGEDSKLRECPLCKTKGYTWMKVYVPKSEEAKNE